MKITNTFLIGVVSFLAGITASLGLGGGMILTLFLTLFAKMPQLAAQGINLLFFLPIAVASLVFHSKNHLVEWKKILPVLSTGIISAIIFGLFAVKINNEILKKAFGVFLVLMGIKELFTGRKKTQSDG